MAAITRAEPPDPPPGSAVPLWLHKVMRRGLARAPEQRFGSMQALLAAIADDPSLRRRKWWMAAGLIGVLGGGAWGVTRAIEHDARTCVGMEERLTGSWDDARRTEVAAAIAATQASYGPDTWERVERGLDDYAQGWVTARTEACEATHRGEQSSALLDLRMACLDARLLHLRETVDLLARADDVVVRKAVEAVNGLPALDRCADIEALTADLPPPEDPGVATRVAALDERLIEADVLYRAGKYPESLAIAGTIVAEGEDLGYEPLKARAWSLQGRLLQITGDYKAAEPMMERALDAAIGQRMTNAAAEAANQMMGLTALRLGRYADARAWAKLADPLSRAADNDAAREVYLYYRGILAQREEHYDEARGYLEEALAIGTRLSGPDLEKTGNTLDALGLLAAAQGNYAEARAYHEQARMIMQKVLGPTHPDLIASIANIAHTYWREADYDQAIRYMEQAQAIAERAFGPRHPVLAKLISSLGALAGEKGDYEQAIAQIQRANLILEQSSPDDSSVSQNLHNIGMFETLRGNHKQAREQVERALTLREKQLGPQHTLVAQSLAGLGWIAIEEEEYARALALSERALAIFEALLTTEHSFGVDVRHVVGTALLGLGRPAEAIPHLERVLAYYTSHKVDPLVELARNRFALARGLWDARPDAGRDRRRARELALLARPACADAGEQGAKMLARVDGWLATHHE